MELYSALVSKKMITIGVTGIMGSGKTLVSGMFGGLGAEVIDADGIVHDILGSGGKIPERLAGVFGEDVLDASGAVDRKKLSEKVFRRDVGGVKKLNDIIHPEVVNVIEKRLASARARGVQAAVIDAPLLIEAGLDKKVDFIVCVRSSRGKAVERLVREGRAGPEDFRNRMRFQMAASEKEERADFIIDNNGSVRETESQAGKIWESITGGKKES